MHEKQKCNNLIILKLSETLQRLNSDIFKSKDDADVRSGLNVAFN